MIKLKLNRDQLYALCSFTNPATYEQRADFCIRNGTIDGIDKLFNLIQIGEMVSKKYLYTLKKSYSIGLKYSEAASLYAHTYELTELLDPLSYEYNLAIILRNDLHDRLTNYQKRFYGQPNRQNLLSAGDSSAGATIKRLT